MADDSACQGSARSREQGSCSRACRRWAVWRPYPSRKMDRNSWLCRLRSEPLAKLRLNLDELLLFLADVEAPSRRGERHAGDCLPWAENQTGERRSMKAYLFPRALNFDLVSVGN